MYGVLTVSVLVNIWSLGKINDLRRVLHKVDNMLIAVGKGEFRIVLGADKDWHLEKV